MKKNVSTIHSLLLLPLLTCPSLLSMDQKRVFNPLEQSLFIPAPTEQGYGFVGTLHNLAWEKEDNILDYLSNNTFYPNNEYHRTDLNTAVQNLITKNQPEKLCALLAAGRKNYAGDIKIGDEQAIAAHNFLNGDKKKKIESLQQKIDAEDKLFIDINDVKKDITELKKSVSAQIIIIKNKLAPNQEQLASHSEKRKTLISQDGDQIRAIKTGLVNLHYTSNLKGKDKHFQDGYCSDKEQDENHVKETYSNDNISQKVDNSSTEKRTDVRNISKLTRKLTALEEDLAELEALAIVSTEKK